MHKQVPKKPKLTRKQALFVEGIAKGKPGYKAALEAYDTDSIDVANAIAVENLQKPSIKEALAPILAKHQITLESAIAPIGKGLKAVRQNEYTGEVTEDLVTQLKASDRALKLLGVNMNDKEGGNTYNFVQVNQQKANDYAD